MLEVNDVNKEYERMRGLCVKFMQEPTNVGPAITAIFDDTCGSLIQINQH